MVGLTDEEIVELNGNCIEVMGRPLTKGEAIKAGSRAQLKKVVGWGEMYCSHDNGGPSIKRWACPICRQALLEEVK